MRTDLYRDPKVCMIAQIVFAEDGELSQYVKRNSLRDMSVTRNVTRNAVIGSLLSVWGVMRNTGKRNGDDLECHGASLTVIDDITDMPGFGHALEAVGWVKQTDEGLVFERFFAEYNVDPAKPSASSAAARQQRYRDKKKAQLASQTLRDVDVTEGVTRDVTVTPREEKRREEVNTITSEGSGQFSLEPTSLDSADEKTTSPEYTEGFTRWWEEYPHTARRSAKPKCFSIWRQKKLEAVADKLVAHTRAMKSTQSWREGYEPASLTYLNQGRYEDDLPTVTPPALLQHNAPVTTGVPRGYI